MTKHQPTTSIGPVEFEKLTLQDHRDLSAELLAIRDRLQAIAIDLSSHGLNIPYRKGMRAVDAVDGLRCRCAEQAEKDIGREGWDIYYPNRPAATVEVKP